MGKYIVVETCGSREIFKGDARVENYIGPHMAVAELNRLTQSEETLKARVAELEAKLQEVENELMYLTAGENI